jgi:hypothetical protein
MGQLEARMGDTSDRAVLSSNDFSPIYVQTPKRVPRGTPQSILTTQTVTIRMHSTFPFTCDFVIMFRVDAFASPSRVPFNMTDVTASPTFIPWESGMCRNSIG